MVNIYAEVFILSYCLIILQYPKTYLLIVAL